MRFLGVAMLAAGCAALLCGAVEDYRTCQRKIDDISSERLRPGSQVHLSMPELNAWVAHQVPQGVRDTKLTVPSDNMAVGTALIDFAKVGTSLGHKPGWLMQKLLEGERPVSVTARIRSHAGEATVDVQSVEIAGMQIDGATLQFLIDHFLLTLYPNAAVGRPFELGGHMDRLEIRPAGVTVVIGE
jgi:hypothetical protein